MPGEDSEWVVDSNEDGDAVVIDFTDIGLDGVTHYVTALPAEEAIEFGEAVIDQARELMI